MAGSSIASRTASEEFPQWNPYGLDGRPEVRDDGHRRCDRWWHQVPGRREGGKGSRRVQEGGDQQAGADARRGPDEGDGDGGAHQFAEDLSRRGRIATADSDLEP